MNTIGKLKITLSITAAFCLCGVIRATVTNAATYWASPQGSSSATCSGISGTSDPGRYGSFARAVACATISGDKVYVKPGTYTSDATIINPSSGITIQGSDSTPANWPVLRPSGTTVRAVHFNNTYRSGIAFRYLRWDMSNVAGAHSCVGSSSDATVTYILEDFECLGPAAGSAAKTASAIKISEKITAIIRRGTISRWLSAESSPGAHGFYWNGSNGLVEQLKIINVNGYCLQWYWTAGSISNNVFRNNICSDATKGGVYIQSNSTGNQVYSNTFCNVYKDVVPGGTGTQIYDNSTSASSCAASTSTNTSTSTPTTPSTPSGLQAVAQ